jgi:site-specific recombinase XerD
MKADFVASESPLAEGIERFVAHKRALGRKYVTEEKGLRQLNRYILDSGVTTMAGITPRVVEAFLASCQRTTTCSYNNLLSPVRRLFAWLVKQEILPCSPVQVRPRRETTQRRPFLFDAMQVHRLLAVAGRLPDNPCAIHRGETYVMIFTLLYGLGLRVSEASHLCWKDVDFTRRILEIRGAKFAKSRLVPFGPGMAKRLQGYLDVRKLKTRVRPDSPVFTSLKQKPLPPTSISRTFHSLLPQLELDVPPGVSAPRLHDLRHSFAVATLLRWYRAGVNPAERLLYLSVFLGHVSPESTAVYLTITTNLLQEASRRFESFVSPLIEEGRSDA